MMCAFGQVGTLRGNIYKRASSFYIYSQTYSVATCCHCLGLYTRYQNAKTMSRSTHNVSLPTNINHQDFCPFEALSCVKYNPDLDMIETRENLDILINNKTCTTMREPFFIPFT